MRSKARSFILYTHRDQMRAGLTDCHTNRGALHPSGFHPHEKQSAAESGKGWGLQITQFLFLPFPRTVSQCHHHPALQEKEALCLIGVSASTPYTITGYAGAVIKVPFQHSTHHDLFQCKHSLSQLNPRPLHWDVNGHFYVGEKEKKCMHRRKKCVAASSGKHGLMGFNHHHERVSQQLCNKHSRRQNTLDRHHHNL